MNDENSIKVRVTIEEKDKIREAFGTGLIAAGTCILTIAIIDVIEDKMFMLRRRKLCLAIVDDLSKNGYVLEPPKKNEEEKDQE